MANIQKCASPQRVIRLLIFDNRIEIISPECLPGNMTVDSIQLGETYQRNPLLASFCAKTMVYRGLGSGIIRAKNDGARIEFRNDELTNQFITTIWRGTGKKGVSLLEKGPSKKEQAIAELLKFCTEPKSIPEIAEFLGMSNRSKLRNNYINSLVGTKLAMTYPNSPRSPRQKYYAILPKRGE